MAGTTPALALLKMAADHSLPLPYDAHDDGAHDGVHDGRDGDDVRGDAHGDDTFPLMKNWMILLPIAEALLHIQLPALQLAFGHT